MERHGVKIEGEEEIKSELTIRKRGIEISETKIESDSERVTKREIAAYALELRQQGYSLQEIEDRVRDFGFDYDKRKLKWLMQTFGLKEADLV